MTDLPEDLNEELCLRAANYAPEVLPKMVATFVSEGLKYAADIRAFEDDTIALAREVLRLPLGGVS